MASVHSDSPLYVLGTAPPPIGGVSIFVQRRLAQLRKAGRRHALRDWAKMSGRERRRWLGQILMDREPAVYELNGLETQAMLALMLRPHPKHLVYWLHSGQFMDRLTGFRRHLFAAWMRRVDELVLVSPHIYPMIERNGFHLPERHRVQYAFLPPPEDLEEEIWATYDEATVRFVEQRRPLLVMQGGDAFYQGVDRYGADVAIEAVLRLRALYPNAGLLIGRPSLGSERHHAYFEAQDRLLVTYGLTEHVHVMTGERHLWPLIKRADVFLRPSNQDGDSVSIREAQHFNVPVVASDACPRAPGCRLFTNRDADDLAAQIDAVLTGRSTGRIAPVGQSDLAPLSS